MTIIGAAPSLHPELKTPIQIGENFQRLPQWLRLPRLTPAICHA